MKANRIALIPSYEPTDILLTVVNELLEYSFTVVVVNDGSESKYDEIFSKLPEIVHYISYENNQGKGIALKTGFKYIKDHFNSNNIIVTLDSDGQHKVSDAIKICEECETSDDNLILGSRFFDKKTPIKSRIGNSLARIFLSLSTHHKIYDTQTGLRAFKYDLLDFLINVKGHRYEYEMKVLLDCIKAGFTIKEVKIETVYFENNAGTHYSPIKDTYKILIEVIKFSASSLIGFFIDYAVFSLLTLIPSSWPHWILFCNIFARIVSASINFTINYFLVFRSKEKIWLSVLKYIGLAVFILGCNTLFLWLLVDLASMNPYLAKIIVEVTMFIVSWIVQRLFVFGKATK